MWRDPVRKRYRWAAMQSQMDELIFELSKAEEEEEIGLYLLRLHYDNEVDLRFFTQREKDKIKKLLGILMNDTARHRELLTSVMRELAEKKGSHAG